MIIGLTGRSFTQLERKSTVGEAHRPDQQKSTCVRSWSRVEINDANAPDYRRRCSFRRSRLNSHGEELPMATGSACVTTRWVLLLVPRPSRAAPAACAGASAASFCCARAFARPGMSNRWRTARTPSSVVMVSTLFGVNDLPAVRDGQRGVAFNGCPLDDLHQAFWPGLRSIIPDDLVTMLAGLKSLFHQCRHVA